jgi:hypothetical protein
VVHADTLSELAVMLGIDAGGLQRTVSRFNGFAKSSVDQDFHPASTETPFPHRATRQRQYRRRRKAALR